MIGDTEVSLSQNKMEPKTTTINQANGDSYTLKQPPEDFLEQFKQKNVEFIVDEIEEQALMDDMMRDPSFFEKMNRSFTVKFRKWYTDKTKKKENISINAKGSTRGGKSLGMLSIIDDINSVAYNKSFDTPYIVCGNQKEYRQKLSKSELEFGDAFLIDENAFANVGMGSVTEMLQLKDIQNIIAKQNIHTFYITPRVFLDTGASLGLHAYGKDPNNWLTKFLLFDLRRVTVPLIGYIVCDIGKLFRKYGCYVYKETGGCTNPNNLEVKDLSVDTVKWTSCVPDNIDHSKLEKFTESCKKQIPCPFYRVCQHPLNAYELKKDGWIEKEMRGGIDERTSLRYGTAIKILQQVGTFEEDFIRVMGKKKQLQIKVNLIAPKIAHSKLNKTELEEITDTVFAFTNLDFLKLACDELELDFDKILSEIPVSDIPVSKPPVQKTL